MSLPGAGGAAGPMARTTGVKSRDMGSETSSAFSSARADFAPLGRARPQQESALRGQRSTHCRRTDVEHGFDFVRVIGQ